MAQVTVNGQSYAVPDDMPPEAALNMIMQAQGQAAGSSQQAGGASAPPAPSSPAAQPPSGSVNPDDLQFNKDWVGASKLLYKKSHGVEFAGTEKDVADWGLDNMGWFNYNLPKMAVDAARIKSASPEEKQAFLYMLDTYDKLDYSWAGVGRFVKGVAMDPTTYVGLSTLGFGSAASTATKIASKAGLKAMLQTGLMTAVEGSVQSAASDYITQTAKVNAGGQAEVDSGEVLKSAAIGAAAGGVLGAGVEAVKTVAPNAVRKALGRKPVEQPWEAVEARIASGEQKVASIVTDGAEQAPSKAVEAPVVTAPKELPKTTVTEPPVEKVAPTVEPAKISDPAERVLAAIRQSAKDSGIRIFPSAGTETTKAAESATEILANVKPEEIAKAIEDLRTAPGTGEQRQLLTATFRDAFEQLQAKSELLFAEYKANPSAENQIKLAQVENIRDKVKIGDEAFSSLQGTELANRVGGINVEGKLRGVTEDTIMVSHNIVPADATDAQKIWAKEEYYRIANEAREQAKKSSEVLEMTNKIAKAAEDGDIATAVQLGAERRKLLDEIAAKKGTEIGIGRKVLNDLNTYIISTVFTTSTLAINTVPSLAKTIYRPLLDYIVTGVGDKSAARQLAVTYHTMATNMDSAFRAAKAAFQYEHGLYNSDKFCTKFDEMNKGTGVFDNRFGRALRIFPRLLGATDEFFGQLHYRGFVMGHAAADAVELGAKNGLTGEALDKFVAEKLAKAHEGMFTKDTVHTADVMDFLRDSGASQGMKGEKLNEWIKTQMDKNGDLFKLAQSQSGRDYADDILFKRKFSGENAASTMAKDYEDMVQKNPWMRPMGQLFFRTPVRVFEEGFRTTAGLNLITPQFLADLRMQNGQARYARAMGEAMLSYGVGMWVMMQYAAGNITGGGPEDYKQRRNREDGKDWEPYTIRVGDKTINYRNIDPFSTGIKIMVNGLDRYNNLLMRQGQGEFIHDTDFKKALAFLNVGIGSIAQAVKDANLTDGIEQVSKLSDDLMNPEDKDQAFTRFFGQKVGLLVPNMAKKVMQTQDNVMPDPVSLDQYLKAAINPSDPTLSHQHDALGNKRKIGDPIGGLTGFKVGDPAAKASSVSDKERFVLKTLSDLGIATGKSFVMPVKDEKLAPFTDDLRTQMTKDGQSTLYDRANAYLKQTQATEALYNFLQGSTKLPTEQRAEAAQHLLKQFRTVAMTKVFMEEAGLRQDVIQREREKVDTLLGKKDQKALPYR